MRRRNSRGGQGARNQGPCGASTRVHDRVLPAVLAGFRRAVRLRRDGVDPGRTCNQGLDPGILMRAEVALRLARLLRASLLRALCAMLLLVAVSSAEARTVVIVDA